MCIRDRAYNDEIVPQTIINQWLNDVGVPEASINGYIKTIRNFMKYRAAMGKVVYLPPFQKTKDLYIPYIFSDEELSNIFAIADAYPMTNKFSSIPPVSYTHLIQIEITNAAAESTIVQTLTALQKLC